MQVSYDYDNNRIATFLSAHSTLRRRRSRTFGPLWKPSWKRRPSTTVCPLTSISPCYPTGLLCRFFFCRQRVDRCERLLPNLRRYVPPRRRCFLRQDPTKVDRSAAYAARKIARDVVVQGWADCCEVQLAYAIGVPEPVAVYIECFGGERVPMESIYAFVYNNYDLSPQGIIDALGLRDFDYNLVSAYGHFGDPAFPWEQ